MSRGGLTASPAGWDGLPPGAAARLDATARNLLVAANELDLFINGQRTALGAVEQQLVDADATMRALVTALATERRDGPDHGALAALAYATAELTERLERLAWCWSRWPIVTLRDAPLAVRDVTRAAAAALRAADGEDLDGRLRALDDRRRDTRVVLRRARAGLLASGDERLALAGREVLRRADDAAEAGEAVRRAMLRLAVR